MVATIRDRIGFMRSQIKLACQKVNADDREWILALVTRELEEALASHVPSETAPEPELRQVWTLKSYTPQTTKENQ